MLGNDMVPRRSNAAGHATPMGGTKLTLGSILRALTGIPPACCCGLGFSCERRGSRVLAQQPPDEACWSTHPDVLNPANVAVLGCDEQQSGRSACPMIKIVRTENSDASARVYRSRRRLAAVFGPVRTSGLRPPTPRTSLAFSASSAPSIMYTVVNL
jgi:hypothetical protein